MGFLKSLYGVESEPSKRSGGATMKTATAQTARKAAPKKTKAAKKPANDPLSAYPPWLRKINKLVEPLTGKLTKCID